MLIELGQLDQRRQAQRRLFVHDAVPHLCRSWPSPLALAYQTQTPQRLHPQVAGELLPERRRIEARAAGFFPAALMETRDRRDLGPLARLPGA